MGKRIILFDQHHPDEPLEAEVEHWSATELSLTIPNKQVSFKLLRQNPESPFQGSLDGRNFVFNPTESAYAALFKTSF
jgi:hypothetical protein